MNWDGFLDRTGKAIDLIIKAEFHAFALVALGLATVIKGHPNEGGLVMGAGLAVFRGNRQ